MIEFKTLVVRDELEAAMALLPSIPQDQMNAVARFLESKGLTKEALGVALDPEYKCVREGREGGRSQVDSGWEARAAAWVACGARDAVGTALQTIPEANKCSCGALLGQQRFCKGQAGCAQKRKKVTEVQTIRLA